MASAPTVDPAFLDKDGNPLFHLAHEPHHPEGSSTMLGFWLYLMSDCLIFAVLFACYGVLGRNYAAGPGGAELFEFAHLIHEGATPMRSGFLSAFFTLVGTHGLHVTFGTVWLVTLMVQVARKGLIPANQRRLMCLSMFWHFLDVVWIGVFTFVYLMGMLR